MFFALPQTIYTKDPVYVPESREEITRDLKTMREKYNGNLWLLMVIKEEQALARLAITIPTDQESPVGRGGARHAADFLGDRRG